MRHRDAPEGLHYRALAVAAWAAVILGGAIDRGASAAVCGVGGCPKIRIDNNRVDLKVLSLAVGDTATQTSIKWPSSVTTRHRLAPYATRAAWSRSVATSVSRSEW